MFWKKLAAGVAAIVSATALGLIILGIIAFFPVPGALITAALVGGFVLIVGRVMYDFGQALCEFLFGWFY